jgi:hypothetical protein
VDDSNLHGFNVYSGTLIVSSSPTGQLHRLSQILTITDDQRLGNHFAQSDNEAAHCMRKYLPAHGFSIVSLGRDHVDTPHWSTSLRRDIYDASGFTVLEDLGLLGHWLASLH